MMKFKSVIFTLLAIIAHINYSQECTICICEMNEENPSITLSCNHTFHKECIVTHIKSAMNSSCPLCRQDMNNFPLLELVKKLKEQITDLDFENNLYESQVEMLEQEKVYLIDLCNRKNNFFTNQIKKLSSELTAYESLPPSRTIRRRTKVIKLKRKKYEKHKLHR